MGELVRLFLRLGTTAVGGPAAHIALMHAEIVERRQWLSRDEFLELLAVSNLLPGPTSTELALHIGHRRAGLQGLAAAGAAFILPAALITLALAMVYVHAGRLPAVQHVLAGLKPAVLAIVVVALGRLVPGTIASRQAASAAVVALVLALLGIHELIVVCAGGVVSACVVWGGRLTAVSIAPWTASLVVALTETAAAAVLVPTVGGLFLVFLKVGSVLFGSGYVLLAFLRAELVVRHAWLTDYQLLDAIAIGQVTPGPVFTTATFLGYLLAGLPGAVAATAGIFLPAFLFVALSGPLVQWLRASPLRRAGLEGFVAASLALMAVVVLQLGRGALTGWAGLAITAATLLVLATTRLNPALPLAAAGVLGYLLGLTI